MKTSTRYGLIAFGFFVFIILAPLLILYVSGTAFNFDSRDTRSTGIFDAKSNPTDATLLIDGKEHSKTPAIARFLNQAEYVFTLKKDGYYDWSKRLPIEAGQVTFAQVGVDEIQMLKKTEPLVIEPTGISNFQLIRDTIWYPLGNTIVHAPISDPQQKTVLKNVTVDTVDFVPMRDNTHLLVRGMEQWIIINTQNDSIFQFPFATEHIEMIANDLAVYTQNNVLLSYNPASKQSTDLVSNVKSFALLGNTVYLLKTDGTITSAVWNGSNFIDEQVILKDVPDTSNESQLIITDRKELFLKNGTAGLYRVGQNLDQIAGHIESVNFEIATNELNFVSGGELWFYNFLTSRPQLLTRSTSRTNSFLIRSSIGYGFVANEQGLTAIEIDTRDQQNRYQLLKNGTVWQLEMTNNQKTIIALQDGSLVMLEVRN